MFYICFSCQNAENISNDIPQNTFNIAMPFIWHWEAEFTPKEKQKIQKYITTVSQASFKVLGNYPFQIHYYIERSNNQEEPIPWAHTERSKNVQGVRFHINPNFDDETFFTDWTAPHEISHLSIPFLGKENAWFAEGYASYMQYQIMVEMGVYSKEEVEEKYRTKKKLIQAAFDDKIPFSIKTQKLRAQYNFPAMYWGGAQYFLKANDLLSKQGKSLKLEIKAYQKCCRLKDKDLTSLLSSLDNKLSAPVFGPLFEQCNTLCFQEIFVEK